MLFSTAEANEAERKQIAEEIAYLESKGDDEAVMRQLAQARPGSE